MNSCHEQELTASIPRTEAAPAMKVLRLGSSFTETTEDEIPLSAGGLSAVNESGSDDFIYLIVATLNAWRSHQVESKVFLEVA